MELLIMGSADTYPLRFPEAQIGAGVEWKRTLLAERKHSTVPAARALLDITPPNRLQQIYVDIHSAYVGAFEAEYVLGYPWTALRATAAQTVEAYRHVVALRGTMEPMYVEIVKLNPAYPKDDPRYATRAPLHPPGAKDYGYGNSIDTFEMACLAFAVGDHEAGREVAALAWDPPDAKYISPDAEYTPLCRQKVAYGLRDMLAGNPEAAMESMRGMHPRRRKRATLAEAAMIRAMIKPNRDAFCYALGEYLRWQKTFFSQPMNHVQRWYYIAVPALGLCSLAVARGVVDWSDLPQDSVWLPLELSQAE